MTLSIIIVNWNVKPLLSRCLESIFQNAPHFDFEIFVVDNASTDGSREYLKEISDNKDNLYVILNEKNLGFAKANNQAISQAKGEYILFLNPDTKIYAQSLEKMVLSLKEHKDWGMVGCKLIDVEGKVQSSIRPFPSFFFLLAELLKFHRFFPFLPIWSYYFGFDFDYSKKGEVDQIMGAFLMTKREVLEQVGWFDENFYIWFEDVDLCYRVKKAGWKNYYNPEAEILHYGGQSFGQLLPLAKQRLYNRSALYYTKKHFNILNYTILKIINPLSLFLAWLVSLGVLSPKAKR